MDLQSFQEILLLEYFQYWSSKFLVNLRIIFDLQQFQISI